MLSYTIREATAEDTFDLCELIKELAVYERLSAEAHPDPHELRRHLDNQSEPRCHALLARDDKGYAAGFALYFRNYSTFLTRWGIHLEDLFVRPDFRGQGIGEALLAGVARIAVATDCGRLELSVLDWNRSAIDFYLNRGATALDDWTTMRFTGNALRSLAQRAPTE